MKHEAALQPDGTIRFTWAAEYPTDDEWTAEAQQIAHYETGVLARLQLWCETRCDDGTNHRADSIRDTARISSTLDEWWDWIDARWQDGIGGEIDICVEKRKAGIADQINLILQLILDDEHPDTIRTAIVYKATDHQSLAKAMHAETVRVAELVAAAKQREVDKQLMATRTRLIGARNEVQEALVSALAEALQLDQRGRQMALRAIERHLSPDVDTEEPSTPNVEGSETEPNGSGAFVDTLNAANGDLDVGGSEVNGHDPSMALTSQLDWDDEQDEEAS